MIEKNKQTNNTITSKELKFEYEKQKKYYKVVALALAVHIIIIGILIIVSKLPIQHKALIFTIIFFIGSALPISLYIIYGLKISKEITINKDDKKLSKSAENFVKTQLAHSKNNLIAEILIGAGLIVFAFILLFLGTANIGFKLNMLLSYSVAFVLIAIAVFSFTIAITNKYYLNNLVIKTKNK